MRKGYAVLCLSALLLYGCTINIGVRAGGAEGPAGEESGLKHEKKEFKELIKGLDKSGGMFNVYSGKDVVYFEIDEGSLGRDYGLQMSYVKGGGGNRDWSWVSQIINFRKDGEWISVVGKNYTFSADEGSEAYHTVRSSFPDSILAQSFIESENSSGGTKLINLHPMFQSIINNVAYWSPIHGYEMVSMAVDRIENNPENIAIKVIFHMRKKGDEGWDMTIPDGKNLEVAVIYNIHNLPEAGSFRPRVADPRMGCDWFTIKDYTNIHEKNTPFKNMVMKFRLEKSNPSQTLSKPKKPIVFWIEKGVPVKYRDLVRKGALAWNRAFEKIGFSDAIVVKQQPDDAKWTGSDIRYNVIHWDFSDSLEFSGLAGPSVIDLRTGETIQAHVFLNGEFPSYARYRYLTYDWWDAPSGKKQPVTNGRRQIKCDRGYSFSSQLAFVRLVLQNRGIIREDNNELNRFFEQAFIELVAHEVGHALGFDHNFKASLWKTSDEVLEEGVKSGDHLSGSVMDYNPLYVPPRGAKSFDYAMDHVGPYDDLMVEYLYTDFSAVSGDGERKLLDEIAGKASYENRLAYDWGALFDNDPYSNTDDFGDDPMRFAIDRFEMIGEIIPNLDRLVLDGSTDYSVLREALDSAIFSVMSDYVSVVARYIGGQQINRRGAADVEGSDPIIPVDPDLQRKALEVFDKYLFSGETLTFPANIRNKLNPPFLLNWNLSYSRSKPVYVVEDRIEWIMKYAFDQLLSFDRLERIQENESRTSGDDRFTLPEYFRTLTEKVWYSSEKETPVTYRNNHSPIPLYRRILQNIHLSHLESIALSHGRRPADAKNLARVELEHIRALLRPLVESEKDLNALDGYTRSHLKYVVSRIEKVLDAQITQGIPK